MSNTWVHGHKKKPHLSEGISCQLDVILMRFVSIYIVLYMSFYIKKSTLTHSLQSSR